MGARCWILSFLLAILPVLAWAEGDGPLQSILGRLTGRQTVKVTFKDATGQVIGGTEFDYLKRPLPGMASADPARGWSCFGAGDFLPPAEWSGALSLYQGEDLVIAPEGYYMFGMLMRMPFATGGCPFPLHPSGNYWRADLPEGGFLLIMTLLEPKFVAPYEVKAQLDGQELPLALCTVQQAAGMMMQGGPPDLAAIDNPAALVAVADCVSISANGDGAAQSNALDCGLQACDRLLQLYASEASAYPASMGAMLDPKAGKLRRLPMNPFDPAKTIFEKPDGREDGYLVYIPQSTPDGKTASAYWLGLVLGDVSVPPPAPLPAGVSVPPVAEWIYREVKTP